MSFSPQASARAELQRATAAVRARLHRVPAFAALAADRLDRDAGVVQHLPFLGYTGRVETARL